MQTLIVFLLVTLSVVYVLGHFIRTSMQKKRSHCSGCGKE